MECILGEGMEEYCECFSTCALVTRSHAQWAGDTSLFYWIIYSPVVANHAIQRALVASRLGSRGPTIETNQRTPRHKYEGRSKRTPIMGT
jgi:hypothetical protein